MINLFSNNLLKTLLIAIIFFNSAYSKYSNHSITVSSGITSQENAITDNHLCYNSIQSLRACLKRYKIGNQDRSSRSQISTNTIASILFRHPPRDLNANAFCLISSISKKLNVFNSQYFHLELFSKNIDFTGEKKANSSSKYTPTNYLLWLLLVNYVIVFFSSFIIIYRTRNNRSKQKFFHRIIYRNREKIV